MLKYTVFLKFFGQIQFSPFTVLIYCANHNQAAFFYHPKDFRHRPRRIWDKLKGRHGKDPVKILIRKTEIIDVKGMVILPFSLLHSTTSPLPYPVGYRYSPMWRPTVG